MTYFPLIGAVVGLAEGITWCAARRSWSPFPAAVVTVAANAALTGALHLDGVADSADGLLAHVPVKDRLEIMAEPQIGTFGTLAVALAISARTAALAELRPSPALLAALGCGSRSVMVIATRSFPSARRDSLVSTFLPGRSRDDHPLFAAAAGFSGATMLALVLHGRRGLGGILAGVAASTGVLIGAHRRIGGITGDVLGAAGVAFETAALLTWSGR